MTGPYTNERVQTGPTIRHHASTEAGSASIAPRPSVSTRDGCFARSPLNTPFAQCAQQADAQSSVHLDTDVEMQRRFHKRGLYET